MLLGRNVCRGMRTGQTSKHEGILEGVLEAREQAGDTGEAGNIRRLVVEIRDVNKQVRVQARQGDVCVNVHKGVWVRVYGAWGQGGRACVAVRVYVKARE